MGFVFTRPILFSPLFNPELIDLKNVCAMNVNQNSYVSFTIKNATVADIPLIRKLTYQVWPQTYVSIISKEQIDYMLEMMYSEASLSLQMKEGVQYIFVYENNDPVGFASYKKTEDAIYKLDKIYILPSQQGKGTGKFVINYILDQIENAGAKSLQLQVNRNNLNAKSFYEKIGFSIIKEADFEIGNGYLMNDFVMEKRINDQ